MAFAIVARMSQQPSTTVFPSEGRSRVVVENVRPQVDCGRFPIKRVVGDTTEVQADVFTDGHDAVRASIQYKFEGDDEWQQTEMQPIVNDRWKAAFVVDQTGTYKYRVVGWIDQFTTWKRGFLKRDASDPDIASDLLVGASLVHSAVETAQRSDRERLQEWERRLRGELEFGHIKSMVDSSELATLMARCDRPISVAISAELRVSVDRPKASFSAWYEMFPRSASRTNKHGTLKDVEALLPYVASMGFDVLYLPPIHPIGKSYRKGPNNSTLSGPDD